MSLDREKILDLIDGTELVQIDGPGPRGWVYFIVCNETARCKIGFTKGDPQKRLRSLQTGSPGELVMLVKQPGTPTTEAKLHERFAPSRVRGEWFDLTDELQAYMVRVVWGMAEIYLSRAAKMEPWLAAALFYIFERLETMPDSLIELLEAEPA